MLYSTLGRTGLIVSRLSFGAMTFSNEGDPVRGIARAQPDQADAMVRRALDAGINFFDTADIYSDGESETILGRALKARRDDVVIATKAGFRSGKALIRSGLSRQHLLWSIDQSLARLGTDWVDVYICHRPDPFTPLEETLAALDAIVRSGKARYLGFSNWPAWQVAAAIELQRANGWAAFSHGQLYYSLVGRDIEIEHQAMLAHYGLGLTVWSPLAGGFLSGKYARDKALGADDRLATFDVLQFDRDRGFTLVDQLRALAESRGGSVAQVALAWLLAKPSVSSILVGASRPAQLDDNLGALDVVLDPAELAMLDAASPAPATYPASFIARMRDDAVAAALGKSDRPAT